jgi:hypothetical protein
MPTLRKTINELPIVMESRELTPGVTIYMVSVQSDPTIFPMVYKQEFGGWFFVDKMTFLELKEREKEISNAIEAGE